MTAAPRTGPDVFLDRAPGTFLTVTQAQRLTCLAVILDLVAGRSVPIQVVERLARWAYDGRGEET